MFILVPSCKRIIQLTTRLCIMSANKSICDYIWYCVSSISHCVLVLYYKVLCFGLYILYCVISISIIINIKLLPVHACVIYHVTFDIHMFWLCVYLHQMDGFSLTELAVLWKSWLIIVGFCWISCTQVQTRLQMTSVKCVFGVPSCSVLRV